MIKDYKGEMPKNVTTPEKVKAKKPFYKDWKFWVLTGLMTLFGACSIYGLVLGSQYVKAIERASHIIADANDFSVCESLSYSPYKRSLANAGTYDYSNNSYTFNVTITDDGTSTYYYDLRTGTTATSTNDLYNSVGYFVCARIATSSNVRRLSFMYRNQWVTSGTLMLNQTRLERDFDAFVKNFTYEGLTPIDNTYYSVDQNTITLSGLAIVNPSYYEGYTAGYSDGYQEGYSDGSDAINVNQSVKVLLPAGAENSCSFTTYLDGVPDQQGILSSSSSFGAYGEFSRDRTQKLRIDLTLPSGYRAFFMYVPNWTSAYPNDENYSLRQSWAVSGVTYLPTWVSKPEIYVGITSALVEDLTYDTISVAFDVDHWGDVKVGAYQQGYQQGYVDGQEDPTAYQSGYDAGKEDGYAEGETAGFNRGVAVGSSGSQSLAMMFKTAFQLPFDQLYRFLNFNLLGINFLSLFTALISVSIGIMVIKKVL